MPCPYGAGDAGPRIAALLREADVLDVITPRERELAAGAYLLADVFGDRAR